MITIKYNSQSYIICMKTSLHNTKKRQVILIAEEKTHDGMHTQAKETHIIFRSKRNRLQGYIIYIYIYYICKYTLSNDRYLCLRDLGNIGRCKCTSWLWCLHKMCIKNSIINSKKTLILVACHLAKKPSYNIYELPTIRWLLILVKCSDGGSFCCWWSWVDFIWWSDYSLVVSGWLHSKYYGEGKPFGRRKIRYQWCRGRSR